MLASAATQTLAGARQHRTLGAGRRGGAPADQRLPLAAHCFTGGSSKGQWGDTSLPHEPLLSPIQLLARSVAVATAASGLLLFSSVPPSLADITTVTPQEATEMAKPLKQQKVNKGRIWALFVLGATTLFGSTVVLENNKKWFPAISRANQAIKSARKQQEARAAAAAREQAAFEQRLAAVQAERQRDLGVETAVMEGLLNARHCGGAVDDGSLAAAVATPVAATADATAATAAGEVEEEVEDGDDEPSSSSSASTSSNSSAGEAVAGEPRKPLFEISAEQIEASSQQRLQELQEELERRKAAGAVTADSGAQPEA